MNSNVNIYTLEEEEERTQSPVMKKTKLLHSHPPNEHEEDEEEEIRRKDMKPYILQLPNHLTVEIFCKIPIKTLIQCRCVCKSWRCSLSDPEFTKYLFSETPTCLLLQNSSSRNPNSSGLFLIDLDNASNRNDVVIKLHKDPNVPTLGVQIVGSCNGFLCLYDRINYGRFYVSNPVLGESLTLPKLPKEIDFPFLSGFGFCPINDVNAYKLVLVSSPSEGCNQGEIMVLTVGSGGWRNVGNFVYPFPFGYQSCGIFHNGFLHWISQCSDNSVLICAFDLESERFQELPLPPWSLEKPLISLGVLKGWLSIFVPSKGNVNVWVMKDYGVQESWTKELVLKQVIGYSASSSATQVLKFTKKGKVLFFQKYKLRVYTPGKRGSIPAAVDGIPLMVEAFVHIPSFVSLNDAIMDLSSKVKY